MDKKNTGHISIAILLLIISFLAVILISFIAPLFLKADLSSTNLRAKLIAPSFIDHSSKYLLGTDNLGRDILIRLIYATRTTLKICLSGMGIAVVIGTLLGVIAGMFGGVPDLVITFLTDARFSVPTTIIGIVCACFFVRGEKTMICLIGFTGWSAYTRLIRGQVLQIKESQYVECSRSMGASTLRIVFEHILPNMASILIVRCTMSLSSYILLESSLSYMGLGIQPPQTSLGIMLSEGRDYLTNQWWIEMFPCFVMILIILQISLIGDWLRDYLDPKLKRRM